MGPERLRLRSRHAIRFETLWGLKRFNYGELYVEPGQEGRADRMITLVSSARAMPRRIFSSNV
jgi:hypothetical protein